MPIELERWEDALQGVLSFVDEALEERFGSLYPLHPARPARGETGSPQYDGLFRVTAAFTAGYGSEKGPGYLFRVEMATLSAVPDDIRENIEEAAAELLRMGLAKTFPNRDLRVERDRGIYKIHGDLSLSPKRNTL